MKQSQDTQNDTSKDLDLIREVGDRAMERLMEEFQLKLDPQKDSSDLNQSNQTELPQQEPNPQTGL